jgi:hypothetical protein
MHERMDDYARFNRIKQAVAGRPNDTAPDWLFKHWRDLRMRPKEGFRYSSQNGRFVRATDPNCAARFDHTIGNKDTEDGIWDHRV